MIRRWRHHRHLAVAEMNITAFMNLMVILVPFLLMTAVFSRLSILELDMPDEQSPQVERQDLELPLTVTVHRDRLEVAFRGDIQTISNRQQQYDIDRLADLLNEIKSAEPQLRQVSILLEPEIPYEVLVRIMDTARTGNRQDGSRSDGNELFPDISIGDAALVTVMP